MTDTILRAPERVRFPLKFRSLRVAEVIELTPNMRRIVLEGPQLEGFRSEGFDDHVKVFPPIHGEAQTLPEVDAEGSPLWGDRIPVCRDYTPRAYEADSGRLALDFATGHGGPVTEWAIAAKVGDTLGLGGPRGSFLVPTDHPCQLLIGDETGLPAILNRLERLEPGTEAVAVIEVEGPQEEQVAHSKARVDYVWLHRQGRPKGQAETLIAAAVKAVKGLDPDKTMVWGAAEARVARALRPALLEAQPQLNRRLMRIFAYWRLDSDDLTFEIEGGEG